MGGVLGKRGGEFMRTGFNTALDPTRRSSDAQDFETALRRKIVGQDPAVEKVVEIYQMFLAGLNAPGRPVGNLLSLDQPVRARPAWWKPWQKRSLAIRGRSSRLT